MLDLAGIPLHARDRGETLAPLVVAGGPCVCNPEPLADFFDLFILGEGEEVNLELMDLYLELKQRGASRSEFLRAAAQIKGIYVPDVYKRQVVMLDGKIIESGLTDQILEDPQHAYTQQLVHSLL